MKRIRFSMKNEGKIRASVLIVGLVTIIFFAAIAVIQVYGPSISITGATSGLAGALASSTSSASTTTSAGSLTT